MHDASGAGSRTTFPSPSVEQQRATTDVPPGNDPEGGVPLETCAPDWREQRQTVPMKLIPGRHQ
jgi:hypothetical protein